MVAKAPLEQPYLSVGSLTIFDNNAKFNGTVFLIRTEAHNRRDIVLGAGHNLTHLAESSCDTVVETYGNRDANMIAKRADDSYRSAIAGTDLPRDFGVGVLAEPIPEFLQPGNLHVTPLLLVTPEDAAQFDATASGAVSAEVEQVDRSIWFAETQVTPHGAVSYSDPDVTQAGMSGGPVVIKDHTASAVGLIHGTGTINLGSGEVRKDLYVTMTVEHIGIIDKLIETSLND